MTEEGSDLTFVEGDAQAVHSRFGAAAEHFDQVLHTHTHHQAARLCLEEHLLCGTRGDENRYEAKDNVCREHVFILAAEREGWRNSFCQR